MAQDFGTPVTPIQEIPPVQPTKSNRTIWIIIAVVVILLCCCCVIAAVVGYTQYGGVIQNMMNNGMNGGGY